MPCSLDALCVCDHQRTARGVSLASTSAPLLFRVFIISSNISRYYRTINPLKLCLKTGEHFYIECNLLAFGFDRIYLQ